MRIRPPIELYMTDEWSCTTCVTAQVLYMLGKERSPFDLEATDHRIGRKPGKPCKGGGFYLEWLRQGLTLTTVTDLDRQRFFGADGYNYIRLYFSQVDPSVLPFMTPTYFEKWRRQELAYDAVAKKLPGRRVTIPHRPTVQDVPYLLQEKKLPAVLVPLLSDNKSFHLGIAYGMTSSRALKLYVPEMRDSPPILTLQTMTLEELEEELAPAEHIVGISL